MVALYVAARFSQLYAGRIPALWIVLLHVVPPAVFAIVHGGILYRIRGIAIFAACCLGIGGLAEVVSLRTGFPFGHYYFTEVMGPKVFEAPVLLVLAYLGMAYVSWVLALLILGYVDKPIRGARVFALPVVAALAMLAWDWSMDPVWSTLERVWIWQQGGAYFGVPLSNFFGWFVVAYIYFFAFAIYRGRQEAVSVPPANNYWWSAIVLYATCGLGNLLLFRLPMASAAVADVTGRKWSASEILGSCALVSLLLMTPFAVLAGLRLAESKRANNVA